MPRPKGSPNKITAEINEMPTNFQIEIIDSLNKYSNKELDNAIKR